MTTDSLITQSILSDSDHHEIAPLLLAFMQSFQLLLTGLPRTIPHPSLPSAYITRRKLIHHLSTLTEEALEDRDMQGPLLEARQAVLDGDQVPDNVRTADLLALLWSVNMPHVLAFWMLVHIISDPKILEEIRQETSKYAKAVQEQAIMGFSVPPRVSIDAKGLLNHCPLLKSAYIETVRLYSRGSRAGVVTKDFELESQEATKVFKSGEKWAFKKGEWVDTSNWLSNTDPSNFADESKWNAACHIVEDESGVKKAEWGNVFSDCKCPRTVEEVYVLILPPP
jgi:cytochrome P450